ncbi:MAG: hypothetical protein R3225_06635 [Halofilum sp. (in: g-proteobacteria)]|nr:hypothetical protein [Halofilum sp. (in: g-proteobacteria)]
MRESTAPGRGAAIAAGLGIAAMVVAIAHGFVAGDLVAEGWAVASVPWGQAMLTDLLTGFLLFGCWMAWREPTAGRAVAWIVALLLLGNLVACVYVLLALQRAGGDADRFWNGPARAGREAA